MTKRALITSLLLTMFLTAFASAAEPKPPLSKTPLTAEQLAVYSAFLKSYDNGAGSMVNLADKTVPLIVGKETSLCLHDLAFGDGGESAGVIHAIPPEKIDAQKYRLVDAAKHKISDPGTLIKKGESVDDAVKRGFAAGLLTISEVVFDRMHTHAVMTFSFRCGGLCGQGGVLVFEKAGNEWKPSKRTCGSWVS